MKLTRLTHAIRIGLALVVVAHGASGCAPIESIRYRSRPRNAFEGMRRVAVAPFFHEAASGYPLEGLAAGDILASEVARFEGFDVVRPIKVLEEAFRLAGPSASVRAGKDIARLVPDVDTAVNVAKSLGVDALIVGTITEHDPFYPPRLGLAIQVIATEAYTLSALDLDRILESGKPLVVDRSRESHVVESLERVYDANEKTLRRQVEAYAAARVEEDSGFRGAEAVLRVSRNYLRFCSEQIWREVIARQAQREREAPDDKTEVSK